MPEISTVISKILHHCEPSHSELAAITRIAQEAKQQVDTYVEHIDDIVDVVFGGSFAKGTWLPHHADIDIFVKFKPSVGIEEFEHMGIAIGSKSLKKYGPKLRYADHPYVEASIENVRVNVVPCYDVEQGKWRSAADRSPFHTQYISSHFDDEKRRNVRLLKKFLKSVGIYGAEISTEGFSGYVSEVLVLKYSTFENVLLSASEWHIGQVISVCKYNSEIVKTFKSPLIIIDPVDSRRNLGSAISAESVGKLMLAARAFIAKPSVDFFTEDMSNKSLKYRHNTSKHLLLQNVLVIEFSHKEKSPDIIWGQVKKTLHAITKQLELAHFEILRTCCVTDEKSTAALTFLLETMTLSTYTKKKGPEIYRKKETDNFLSNRKRKPLAIWVDREMRVSMVIERRATDVRKLIKPLLLSNHGSSIGIPKDLIIENTLRIYSAGDKKRTKGLVNDAIEQIISTEPLIFR